MKNPTWNSHRYATTKGLGSICYGSFLVALIRTLKAFAKSAAQRGNALGCICYICLAYLEWLARYFSVYAFVQVAIYGVSFWQAAKNTWQLLTTKGFDAIINDDLSNLVLAAGAIAGGVITSLIGGLLGYLFFVNYGHFVGIVFGVLLAIVGLYIGYFFTLEFMFAIASAIKAIFVCWAEDPAALKETHPLCYELMAQAWRKVYNIGGVNEINTLRDLD
ncbi:hypothetical protein RFI_14675 [Reticulomyxa filosa]|uniref:Choline transporter-like protein n=1 Tax=Reticulomyxa filosa TaxID=46433 RepID=X6N8C0_RETFI|nr:hypothetical protein RFI_14675 [Reticulomyxa filosa]|eukprot:ETO22525.1 hypothetical protein RFI_14675 [Reticulomyxa filosa]